MPVDVARRVGRARGADKVEQMGTFCVVEMKGTGDAFEHVVGNAVGVAALESRVVLDADPGEHRHLLAAKAFDAPVRAVDGESGLFRGDLGATGGEKLADALLVVHAMHVTTTTRRVGVPTGTPLDAVSLARSTAG